MSCYSLSLDPAPLGRTAAVVRLGGDVGDGADLEAGGLEGTDRGLPAGAGALHEHVDLLHAVLGGLAGGALGGHLRGERSGLTRALEAHVTTRRPRDHGTGRVRDRDDGVVEGALDVRVAVRDILLFLAADLLGPRRGTRLRWHVLRVLLLARVLLVSGDRFGLAAPDDRTGVGVQVAERHRAGVERLGRDTSRAATLGAAHLHDLLALDAHFLPAFFLPATVFFGPLRVRALVFVR